MFCYTAARPRPAATPLDSTATPPDPTAAAVSETTTAVSLPASGGPSAGVRWCPSTLPHWPATLPVQGGCKETRAAGFFVSGCHGWTGKRWGEGGRERGEAGGGRKEIGKIRGRGGEEGDREEGERGGGR